ncbi:DUF3108 domain-containing protein [Phorcysia thermohydrogeniphila]|uniref:Uncharacterized protein DUF3108 n=1 Tax=Phorcysia thermohydrogeniphila TaxID=936138 RepID=A0A4R1GIB2_9BACT|nr:DUF3108 domain-containing protein [Phorcysia thermohydrogeniphila]TCK03972.1 uncharacterized protein DUF3108 [Phorcysia thermohydrogeniphila]
MPIGKLLKKVIAFTVTATLCLSFSAESAFLPELKVSGRPSDYDFDGEELKFKLYWTIFHVADSKSKVTRLDKDRYKFQGKVSTAGIAAWFKKIEDRGYSIWNEKTLCPEKTYIYQKEGDYERERIFTYDLKRGTVKYEKRNPKKNKVQVKVIKIPFTPFQDIVTSAYFFRRYGIFEVGKETVFPLFAGGKFQNVSFKVVKKETIDTLFGKMEVFRVIPSENLSPEGAFKRKGKVIFWFTADRKHLPVKIVAEVAIGSVSAVLVDAKGKGFDLRKDYEKQKKRDLLEKVMTGTFGGE